MTGTSEKRKEPRRNASGHVRVRFSDPGLIDLEGGLVDFSGSGFRMSHACTALETGVVVEFWHSAASGHARLMWNRVMPGGIESGFLVIASA